MWGRIVANPSSPMISTMALPSDVCGLTSEHVSVGLADKLVAQVTTAPGQHERRLVDDQFEFRFLGAQTLFGLLLFDQIGGLSRQNVEEVQRAFAGLLG